MPLRGSKSRSPVASSKAMQAKDHTSAGVLYFAPSMTSGHLYCLVWMSWVKCLYVQHALPRSTMTACIASMSSGEGGGPRRFFLLPALFSFFSPTSPVSFAFSPDFSASPSDLAAFLAFFLAFFFWFLVSSLPSSPSFSAASR